MNNSSRLRWAGHVFRMEEGRRAFKILTGKSTGSGKSLGWQRHRWKDTIIMDVNELVITKRKRVDSALDGIIGKPL